MSIEPTIFIAAASLVISLIIAVFNIWRANKADNREDSAQLTTVIVQLFIRILRTKCLRIERVFTSVRISMRAN